MFFVRYQTPGRPPSLLARILWTLGAVALLSFLFFFAFTFFIVAMVAGSVAFLVQAFRGSKNRPQSTPFGGFPHSGPGATPPPRKYRDDDDVIDV